MASLQTLGVAVLVILTVVIMGAIAVKIVADVGALINSTQAQQVANQGLTSINVIFQWLPLVSMVVVAAVILYLLIKGIGGSLFGGGE
jgi:nitric oxide reductase large subunit